ncbi:hypothetical protein HJFPF1_03708 [Paramyrothecium foliicola]|nr:hypothetical protein HJFPF1_03708 [Paramyrothecium foliicola]
MRHSAILSLATAALLPVVSAKQLVARQNDTDETAAVCSPEYDGEGPVPPCIQVTVIENLCEPNGTDAIDYEAHAQCMCNGSYFSDWRGCENCLLVHGFRSERDNAFWERIMTSASDALCTGTPTAIFRSLFASAETNSAVAFPTTGSTQSSDQFPDETAVSLYYTPTGSQGPGRITGAATSATAEATETPTESSSNTTTTTGAGNDDDDDDETSTETEPAPTSTSPDSAAPTKGAGLVLALAGAAIIAAI